MTATEIDFFNLSQNPGTTINSPSALFAFATSRTTGIHTQIIGGTNGTTGSVSLTSKATKGLFLEYAIGKFDGRSFTLPNKLVFFEKVSLTNVTLTMKLTYSDGTSYTVNGRATGRSIYFSTSGNNVITNISFNYSATSNYSLKLERLSYTDSCISGDSLVLTQTGPRPIMELQRGDKTIEGSTIARIIEQPVLLSNITLAVFDTPNGPVKTCLHHVFIHEGKRKLAQNMPGVRIVSGKTEDLLPNSTLYDIQFDFEGSYTVGSNLISQSRSPYCILTPLPKELYFIKENYKSIRVDNTLMEYPSFE